MAPPASLANAKDPKVGLSVAMHYLKSAAPAEFSSFLNVIGAWESREILSMVGGSPDKLQNLQGRAQVMHELMVLLVECSTKTRQYEEQANVARPAAPSGT